jgi:hypothetical protein
LPADVAISWCRLSPLNSLTLGAAFRGPALLP